MAITHGIQSCARCGHDLNVYPGSAEWTLDDQDKPICRDWKRCEQKQMEGDHEEEQDKADEDCDAKG